MRIIVDTNVFFDRAALSALWADPRPKIVPSVVFTERARQLYRAHGMNADKFAARLRDEGWLVEDYGEAQAARIAGRLRDDPMWRRHFRDAMIAGHVEEMDELWTANATDFLAVGLDARHIVDLTRRGSEPPER